MVVTDLPESMLCMLKTHATIVLPALSPLHISAIITFGCAEMHVARLHEISKSAPSEFITSSLSS